MDILDVQLLSVETEAHFDMQFHLIVVLIFLETRVKDHDGDGSSRLLERRVRLVCIKALLLAVL